MAEVRLIDSSTLKSVPWKNGLGESTVIAQNESFWKFSRTAMKDSCSMAVEPGCDVALVVLQGSTNIQHRDEASSLSLCPLTPYVYQGEWPTSLQVSGPQSHLILSINRSKAYLTMALESLKEGLLESSELNTSHKILLSHTTLLYIISGNLELTIDSTPSYQMHPHQMLWIQRQDQMSPTELTIRPVNGEDAKVLLIQIDHKPASNDVPNPYKLTRTTTGSAFVYVERPGTERSHVDLSASTLDLTGSMTSLGSCHLESIRHYKPPSFTSRAQNESAVPPAVCRDSLNIEEFPKGVISTVWINMVKQGLSEWVRIPVIVARGIEDGPVVGLTAVVHGNELNGVPCIHRVITDLDVRHLKGTVVAIPCVNVPGYLRFAREFSDGKDLNRLFPGKKEGTASEIFAYQLLHKIVIQFNYLIDMHTASFGRINSYYVRSDMNDPVSAMMAKFQQPQIILHNSGQDGTLRSAAMTRGIKAITVEIGNPQQFQNVYVQWSYMGVMRIMSYLKMFSKDFSSILHDEMNKRQVDESPLPLAPPPTTILCSKGFWIYTQTGGVLEVYPPVNTLVTKGALIARIKNIFGNIVDEIYSPATGVTIGRSSNPVAMAGDRVLHLGIIKKEGEALALEAKENY